MFFFQSQKFKWNFFILPRSLKRDKTKIAELLIRFEITY